MPRPTLLTLLLVVFTAASCFCDDVAPIVKRRTKTTEEELRKELLDYKDIGLDQSEAKRLYELIESATKKNSAVSPDIGATFYGQVVSPRGFSGLPWKTGKDAAIGMELAEALNSHSQQLRDSLRSSVPRNGGAPDGATLRSSLSNSGAKKRIAGDWTTADAVPALTQLLQAEGQSVRELLVEKLADIDGKEASIALARRALFDLSPDVREKAIRTLAKRPEQEYWPVLADGFRYPWPAAADHAAEATVALRLDKRLTELVSMLGEPDPKLAFKGPAQKLVARQLVRLNHMTNCYVCHAPSQSQSQSLRGLVPKPGTQPPPAYYSARSGMFVRADITYLRQEFSVMQSVSNPDKWPGHQRYDYFVLTRPATDAERNAGVKSALRPRTDLDDEPKAPADYLASYPQRESVLFALRELTGANPGKTAADWAKYLKSARKE